MTHCKHLFNLISQSSKAAGILPRPHLRSLYLTAPYLSNNFFTEIIFFFKCQVCIFTNSKQQVRCVNLRCLSPTSCLLYCALFSVFYRIIFFFHSLSILFPSLSLSSVHCLTVPILSACNSPNEISMRFSFGMRCRSSM